MYSIVLHRLQANGGTCIWCLGPRTLIKSTAQKWTVFLQPLHFIMISMLSFAASVMTRLRIGLPDGRMEGMRKLSNVPVVSYVAGVSARCLANNLDSNLQPLIQRVAYKTTKETHSSKMRCLRRQTWQDQRFRALSISSSR